MKPSYLTNADYTQQYSGHHYPSTTKAVPSYQRNLGPSYDEEPPRNYSPFATRMKHDNQKYSAKSEAVDFRPAQQREYSAPKIQGFSSTYTGFYHSNDQKSEENRDSYDPYRSSHNFGQGSYYRNPSTSAVSRPKESILESPNILTRKKYDIDLNSETSPVTVIKGPAELRPSSAKNYDLKSKFEDSSYKPITTKQIDEFISKYKDLNVDSKLDRSETTPRGFSLNRTTTSSKPVSTTLRNSYYAEPSHTQSSPSMKKPNNFHDVQNNNETSSKYQKTHNYGSTLDYKKYELKDNDYNSTSSNKPLLTRSELNLRKIFENNSNPDQKVSLFGGYDESKSTIQSTQNHSHQNHEKVSLDSLVTKLERGSLFPFKKSEIWLETNLKRDSEDEGASSRDSPSRLSPTKENKILKDAQKNAKESLEMNKWTGKSTRASSSRNDDSTDSSQEEDLGDKSFVYYLTNLKKALREYNNPEYFSQIYREHFQQSYQSLRLCKYISPPDFRTLASRKQHFTKKEIHRNKKTLIFDLDETLIHCVDSPMKRCDIKLPVRFPQGEVIEAGINVRPYAVECLRELSQYYEIMVFTASHKNYATVILDYLDPEKRYIQHRLFRDSCVYTDEGFYVKDLRVLANRDLHDVILVDNAAYSFGFQIENGIPIIPFYDNKNDQELKHLTAFLKGLSKVKNVREVIKKTFKFHEYAQYSSADAVIDNVILKNK